MPIGQIFQGVTTAPCRDYVAKEIINTAPQIVYMPCAGRFGSAQAYINHGGNRETLMTSDICLFSSMLGYLFDDTKSVKDLGIINNSLIQPRDDNDIEVVSAAMLAIKYGQIKANTQYGINIRKEMVKNSSAYLDKMAEKIRGLTDIMQGSRYSISDLWDVISEARDNEAACIFLNVPTHKGGYNKTFKDSGITWNEPDIDQFEPDTYQKMVDTLTDAKCHVLVYSQKNLDKIPDSWRTVYAQPYGIDRTDYVVSNRKTKLVYAVSKTKPKPHKLYPIYDDSEITQDTKIEFIQVDQATALYYRDLFVHKLGTTTAESFYLMLIDGKVNTALGLSLRDVFTQKTDYVGEVFGISKSSTRYKRLGKLFMFCLTSGDFQKFLMAKYNFGTRKPRGIKTSSLTTYAEGKTDRSVMKLTFREQLKDGTYRVIYQGDFRDDTYQDCIKRWLKRWGKIKRSEEVKPNGENA